MDTFGAYWFAGLYIWIGLIVAFGFVTVYEKCRVDRSRDRKVYTDIAVFSLVWPFTIASLILIAAVSLLECFGVAMLQLVQTEEKK